jgi:Fic family protein
MAQKVHTFSLEMDWKLINSLSKIDRFDARWSTIEKREGRSLKQLKSIATVRSVGASTRIEGSAMTDDQVEALIQNLDINKLEDRDAQEVAGYFTTLDIISDSYEQISVTETGIKGLHNNLMRFSSSDEWHRGAYKQHSNSVQAQTPEGRKYTIFETTTPGIATDDAMRHLMEWYDGDHETHPLVKSALFCYDFVSIHPFQDGNGRMSRLLASLVLLKHGYKWIQYVSFEHEIESRKGEYYRRLMDCQKDRPNEEVTTWVLFFLECLSNIQDLLLQKLEGQRIANDLSPRDKRIVMFIEFNDGCSSGDISRKLDIPLPTVKKALSELVGKGIIEKKGTGPATHYSVY